MVLNRLSLLILLAMAALSAGCGNIKQQPLAIEYYSLEYQSSAGSQAMTPLPVLLRLENFSASPLLQTDRLAYRDKEYSNALYYYHRWRAKPAELVTHFLGRDLQQSGIFRSVSTPFDSLPHTHALSGTVDKFMEWDDADGWQALIVLRATLIDSQASTLDQQVLFQKEFRASKPCRGRSPVEVAAAMSMAMDDISGQIASQIHQTLAELGQQR